MVNVRPILIFLAALAVSALGVATTAAADNVFVKAGSGTYTLHQPINVDLVDIEGGTLLLGSGNLISDNADMRLHGGNFATGGFSDRLGELTLAANSTIDLGNGSSILHFANSAEEAWTSGTTLTIVNWNGDTDALFFGSAMTALTSGQVSQIRFLNPNGVTGIFGAQILSDGRVVPVPEPATIGFGILLVGAIGLRERERLARGFSLLWRKVSAA
jgi:hypothetical protein